MIEQFQNRTLYGNAPDVLKTMPDGIAQMCVTSPPYWGLRDYGEETSVEWPDGWVGQLGLEPTPELYVLHLEMIFTELKRVLKDNGTLWLNIGDSYHGSSKNLVGIPWRVAFALQRAGWYLRCEIIWHKPNCMPESVKDRPTNAHENIFLLSKSKKYYYDHEAIMEPLAESTAKDSRLTDKNFTHRRPKRGYPGQAQNGSGLLKGYGKKRNKRTVWDVPLVPYKEAHFAAYPPPVNNAVHQSRQRKRRPGTRSVYRFRHHGRSSPAAGAKICRHRSTNVQQKFTGQTTATAKTRFIHSN